MDIRTLYFVCAGLWIAVGLIWLVPRKVKLIMRLGSGPDSDIARAAKAGDIEAQRFRRDGLWYLVLGLAVMLPLSWLRYGPGST
jgi:hypothetical protein